MQLIFTELDKVRDALYMVFKVFHCQHKKVIASQMKL
jgi:hypothetical protein